MELGVPSQIRFKVRALVIGSEERISQNHLSETLKEEEIQSSHSTTNSFRRLRQGFWCSCYYRYNPLLKVYWNLRMGPLQHAEMATHIEMRDWAYTSLSNVTHSGWIFSLCQQTQILHCRRSIWRLPQSGANALPQISGVRTALPCTACGSIIHRNTSSNWILVTTSQSRLSEYTKWA